MTTAVATLPRRRFLLDEDEKLLMSRDVLDFAERLNDFISETGIEPERLTADPVVAIPLPIHARGARFDGVKPDALWNPLFWLPESIALRVRIRETEYSEPRPETDQEWSLRIVDHLYISGAYTPEEGWVDVFALYGINPDDPDDLAAIEAWQAGLPEERLDAIDLTEHLDFGDINETFAAAQELYPLVMAAQWGYTASSFLVTIEQDPTDLTGYTAFAVEMLAAEPSANTDLLEQAHGALVAGDDPSQWEPKVTTALSNIVADYANAIYELERL